MREYAGDDAGGELYGADPVDRRDWIWSYGALAESEYRDQPLKRLVLMPE